MPLQSAVVYYKLQSKSIWYICGTFKFSTPQITSSLYTKSIFKLDTADATLTLKLEINIICNMSQIQL